MPGPRKICEMPSERDKAFLLFGRAMAAWAKLEKGFYAWFEHITLLDMKLGQPLYFAPTSFMARTNLIRAALKSNQLEPAERAFIEKALGCAGQYNSFRNKLAHGEFTVEGLLIESKEPDYKAAKQVAVTQKEMAIAANNFQALADLLWKARDTALGFILEDEPEASLEMCLVELDALPKKASDPA
jgi:hypothetical protein